MDIPTTKRKQLFWQYPMQITILALMEFQRSGLPAEYVKYFIPLKVLYVRLYSLMFYLRKYNNTYCSSSHQNLVHLQTHHNNHCQCHTAMFSWCSGHRHIWIGLLHTAVVQMLLHNIGNDNYRMTSPNLT